MKNFLSNRRPWAIALLGLGMMLSLAGLAMRATAAETHGTAAPAAHGAAHDAAPAHGAASHADAAGHGSAGHAAHGHGVPDAHSVLTQFGYSYLTAYMFCLSLCAASLYLVFLHHIFDAGWSVPVRRMAEHVSSLMFPWMLILVVPILLLATRIYPWITLDPAQDHALDVKKGLFNPTMFYVLVPLLVASWGLIARAFRRNSLAQDKGGSAVWTGKNRVLAAWGIFYFSLSLTLGVFYLMKSLQHQFFSTMYGVYYFAGSMWLTFITMYVLARYFSQPGKPLAGVVGKRQVHDLGVLFFAFTVFYAYIHFSQYFLIWNAAMPEETFWYVLREVGTWKWVGFLILFGHFVLPFVVLLNQDIKSNLVVMIPVAAWAWLMHYVDMTFNIMPVLYPQGLHLSIWDLLCWPSMVAVLAVLFLKEFRSHPAYPLKDPRLKEAITHHEIPAPGEAAAHH